MSFADERLAIERQFANNYAGTVVKYENVPFVQPNSAWVSLHLLSGEGNQVSVGTARSLHRYVGVVQVDIYIPEDGGTAQSRTIADVVEAIFRGKQIAAGSSGTITFRTPFYVSHGIENGWYRATVSTTYQRDKIA